MTLNSPLEPITLATLSPAPELLQNAWEAQLAGLSADALRFALEHQLFMYLDTFVAPERLAAVLRWNNDNTAYFLELLWSLALVERQGDCPYHYRNTSQTAYYLNPTSSAYCGDALLFRLKMLRQVGQQLEGLMKNSDITPLTNSIVEKSWAEAAKTQIAQEQRVVTTVVACYIVKAIPNFSQAKRFLDLGGGPGLVAIALAQQQPTLQGVVFDYTETTAVAQKNIAEAGLQNRITTLSGDLATDEFGSGYDLIWCSSVLHFVPDIPALLAHLHHALHPGGVLICCHAEIHNEAKKAKPVLHYYLHMRTQGRHVLPQGQLAKLMLAAGFNTVQQFDETPFPVAPVTTLIAHKATQGE